MRVKRSVIAVFLFIFVLAACSSNTDEGSTGEQKLEKVRYAAFTGVSGLAVRYGAEKGFFEEEGLDVEFITTRSQVEGIVSNDIDVADIATTSAIIAAGKGAPIKIVSSMFRTKGPFYLLASPEIETVEQLKGKTVGGAEFGSGLDLYTQKILRDHGLSKEDVDYVSNGVYEGAYASLTTKQVDATIIHEPFASIAELTGEANLLALGWEYLPNFHTGVLIAGEQFIEKRPEVLEKLLRAYFRSQVYAKENVDEYKAYFIEQMKLDPEALDLAFEREFILWENNPNVDVNMLNETQQTQIDFGFQDELYDLDKILDLRFIPEID